MSANLELPLTIETMAPFRRSREQRSAIAARVDGAVPDWLRGEVVRTCPAVFDTAGWHARHWFDGLCMLYAWRIGAGGVDFRSRLLESEAARDAWQGKARLGSFGTPTDRPLWRRIVEPVPHMTDNDNVNIVRMNGDLVALTEGSRQLIIDAPTLSPIGPARYAPGPLDGALMTAHPHLDIGRSKIVNVATAFGAGGVVSLYEQAVGTWRRELVASWRTAHIPYIHTFGLTPQHAILAAHPFTVKTSSMLWSSKGYIDHFTWRAQEGTRLIVIDRASGALREHVTEPFFCFHTVNAFERGEETVLDLLAYPDAGIVDALRVERMAAELPDLRPSLVRLVMRPGVERARFEEIGDHGFEFPAIAYRRASGQPYRYAWGAADGPQAQGYPSAVVKIDLENGSSTAFADPGFIFGEPLFVGRPGGAAEDDGVLLSVGSARDGEHAVLTVIDAASMTALAMAHIGSAIPLGFHGSFVAQAGG